jgi:cytochrome c oxidase cbb3-type subunit III
MSDHHDQDSLREHTFDGIQEYDNKLPNWWLWILYGSIVFSLGYWLFYHSLGAGKLPLDNFQTEMRVAAEAQLDRLAAGGLTNQALLVMSELPDRVQAGHEVYDQYCAVCHGDQGGGTVGPNLTDDHWIHGGAPLDLHRIVVEGVPAKGMAAWGNQLGPTRVQNVVAYMLTLRGRNVPGKAPEGDFYDLAAESFADEAIAEPATSPEER